MHRIPKNEKTEKKKRLAQHRRGATPEARLSTCTPITTLQMGGKCQEVGGAKKEWDRPHKKAQTKIQVEGKGVYAAFGEKGRKRNNLSSSSKELVL